MLKPFPPQPRQRWRTMPEWNEKDIVGAPNGRHGDLDALIRQFQERIYAPSTT